MKKHWIVSKESTGLPIMRNDVEVLTFRTFAAAHRRAKKEAETDANECFVIYEAVAMSEMPWAPAPIEKL